MNIGLRAWLVVAALMVFALILLTITKRKLNIKYSIVWLLWSVLTMILAVFPEIFYSFAHFMGIEMPVNAVFLIMIGLLYVLVFYVYCMISKHNEELIQLTYEIARLKKELDEMKKKNER